VFTKGEAKEIKDGVSLWYCERCNASGVVYVESSDVYSVVNVLRSAHVEASPECMSSVRELRIADPTGWFSTVKQSMQEAERGV
jgi:hypothetical protein